MRRPIGLLRPPPPGAASPTCRRRIHRLSRRHWHRHHPGVDTTRSSPHPLCRTRVGARWSTRTPATTSSTTAQAKCLLPLSQISLLLDLKPSGYHYSICMSIVYVHGGLRFLSLCLIEVH